MVLGFEGFTPDQIAQIREALPKAAYLVKLVKENLTTINAVLPVLLMVIQVVNAKQKEMGNVV